MTDETERTTPRPHCPHCDPAPAGAPAHPHRLCAALADAVHLALDHGYTQLVMARPGPDRPRTTDPAGGHVRLFELPRLPPVRLPGLPPEPAATRGRTLPAFPPVAVPAPPSGALRLTGFPIDVTRWFDARPERPRHRWPRWLRKPWA